MDVTGCQVLFVDDSPTVRLAAEEAFAEANVAFHMAENGYDAIAWLAHERPHLIFLDRHMPMLDGIQTAALLKAHPRAAACPIVMLTGEEGYQDKAVAQALGIDVYLLKPFTQAQLLAIMQAQGGQQ